MAAPLSRHPPCQTARSVYAARTVKAKQTLPIILLLVFALTRVPGLMPPNFSAAYGLLFCAGVYFSGAIAWWLPLSVMLGTDLLLNWYYGAALLQPHLLASLLAYASLILLGRQFSRRSSWLSLLAGGVSGAILFYLVTNTLAWFFNPFANPEYTKTLGGWITALTKGTAGYPQTWEFFRNTLLSGGLFTGLFAGAMKLSESRETSEEETTAPDEEPEEAAEADEAKA